MKKGYQFKLEALLKIRRLKEEQCKMEIGLLQVQITNLKNEIGEHDHSIDIAYDSQEKSLNQGLEGQDAKFYPYFIEGKRAHIQKIQNHVNEIQKVVDQKLLELAKLRGDVKVIEKMKEKDFAKYKKEKNKMMDQRIEEQIQNWKHKRVME